MLLSDKYSPATIGEVVGNVLSVGMLRRFGEEAQKGHISKPIMIYGPNGVGKTCAAHALANTYGFELLELNASDYRDAETLRTTLLPAGNSSNLFKKRVLIVLDEVDELSGKFDSGAEKTILELIKKSRQPIIFIANDFWDKKIAFLRDAVEKCEFKRLGFDEVSDFLKKIAANEGKEISSDIIDGISSKSNGDLRGAINDLELMLEGSEELMEHIGYRNRKMEIFSVLDKIFQTNSFATARSAAAEADVDLGMLINWVDENIPNRYSSKRSRYEALDNLSLASRYLEVASRTSHYDYLKYSSMLASAGVSLSSNGNFSMLKQYSFPASIRFLSLTKKSRGELRSIVSKLVYKIHAGRGNVSSTYITMFKVMIERAGKEEGMDAVYSFFESKYELNKEEVDAIASSKKY